MLWSYANITRGRIHDKKNGKLIRKVNQHKQTSYAAAVDEEHVKSNLKHHAQQILEITLTHLNQGF